MGKDHIDKQRRLIGVAYFMTFLALFTVISALFGYLLARKVAYAPTAEVWLQAHGLWIMRNLVMAFGCAVFASLWFIPLHFVYWSDTLWSTATSVIGVCFALIAWLFLLNAWLKGVGRFFSKRAVF